MGHADHRDGAPGGSIYSTVPIEKGRHGNNSGTSMSSPHVAGVAALVLEAKPNTASNAMRTVLQNSADPKNWWKDPASGLLDNVHRQGAGMADAVGAINATVTVEPGKLSLGESSRGSHVETLTDKNDGTSGVTFDHGGYVVLTPQGCGQTYRVPYTGLKGDYQSIQVLTPTPNGFPWLAKTTNGTTFSNNAAGVPYRQVLAPRAERPVRREALGTQGAGR